MAEHDNNPKKGYTVAELEGKVKKYCLEIDLCVMFVLTGIFTLIWGGAMVVWSILLCMIFCIVSVLVPRSINKVTTHTLQFVYKEKITSIIVGVVGVLFSIFLPPIIFAVVGIIAGKTFSFDAQMQSAALDAKKKDKN